MICPKCGTENADNNIFCTQCDTLLLSFEPNETAPAGETTSEAAAYPPPRRRKKKADKKKTLKIAFTTVVVILLVTVCVIIGALRGDSGFIAAEEYYQSVISGGSVVVIHDDQIITTDLSATSIRSSSSLDGTVSVFLTNRKQLYVVRDGRLTVISDNVASFQLSASGNAVAYATNDGKNALYLCKLRNCKSTLISEDYQGSAFVISPDGKSVLYNDYVGGKYALQYFSKGKTRLITHELIYPAGLSDNGKYMYAYGANEKLENIFYCFDRKGNRQTLGTLQLTAVYRFNDDHTQVLFHTVDGKTFASVKGQPAEQICDTALELVLPQNANSLYATYPVHDLFDHVYQSDVAGSKSSLWYIHKNTDKSCELMADISDPQLDASGKYIYLKYQNDLYRLKIAHKENAAVKAKRIAMKVHSWVITSNCKKVYYISEDALFCANGITGTGKKTVAENGIITNLSITHKDVVFFIMNGNAYSCKSGKQCDQVLSDAAMLYSAPNGMLYLFDRDRNVYVSSGKAKITKLCQMK